MSTGHNSTKWGELDARIVGFDIIGQSSKQYAVYDIEVAFSILNWRTKRRFSEFYALNKIMRSKYSMLDQSLMSFPSRLKRSLATDFLNQRMKVLNSYLQQLLSLAPLVTEISKCEELIQFFEIAVHLRRSRSAHRQSVARTFFPDIYSTQSPGSRHRTNAMKSSMNNIDGNYPIHSAAQDGLWEEITDILRKSEGAILLRDVSGQTPLHYAARSGHSNIVRLFLAHCAPINAIDSKGWTPLQCACVSRDIQCVLTLLEEESVDVTAKNTDDNTALHYLARYFDEVEDSLAKTCVKIFSDKRANVNAQNRSGETPLHNACWKGCSNFVRALLLYGADPNLLNKSGESPLHWAAREKHEKVIALLLRHGADINMRGLFGPIMNYPLVETIYNQLKAGKLRTSSDATPFPSFLSQCEQEAVGVRVPVGVAVGARERAESGTTMDSASISGGSMNSLRSNVVEIKSEEEEGREVGGTPATPPTSSYSTISSSSVDEAAARFASLMLEGDRMSMTGSNISESVDEEGEGDDFIVYSGFNREAASSDCESDGESEPPIRNLEVEMEDTTTREILSL